MPLVFERDPSLSPPPQGFFDREFEIITKAVASETTAAPEDVDTPWIEQETYAQSVRPLEKLGAALGKIALGNVEMQTEADRLLESVREDWESLLVEMISTDEEFKEHLEVVRERSYDIRDGQVVFSDSEGRETPAIEMIGRGAEYSKKIAEKDSRMAFQANRDANDLYNAEQVDAMQPGMMRVALSMDPKDAYRAHGQEFVNGLGYRSGWASIQMYYKPDHGQIITLTHTITGSDMKQLRQIYNSRGANIPEDVVADDFIRYALETSCGSIDDAKDFMNQLKREAYAGRSDRRSVDEFLAQHQSTVNTIFQTYIPAIAEAYSDGSQNEIVSTFARSMYACMNELQQAGGKQLDPELLQQLYKVTQKEQFDAADARLLEEFVRYAAVEQLRPSLKALISGTETQFDYVENPVQASVSPHMLSQQLAGGAAAGVRSGRSYGGCSLSRIGGRSSGKNKQDTYGGLGESIAGSGEDYDAEEADDRPPKFTMGVCQVRFCPTKGEVGAEVPKKTLVGECSVCLGCEELDNLGFDLETFWGFRQYQSFRSLIESIFENVALTPEAPRTVDNSASA